MTLSSTAVSNTARASATSVAVTDSLILFKNIAMAETWSVPIAVSAISEANPATDDTWSDTEEDSCIDPGRTRRADT